MACEYCSGEKPLIDQDGETASAYVEVANGELAVDFCTSDADASIFVRVPIDYCPKCGRNIQEG